MSNKYKQMLFFEVNILAEKRLSRSQHKQILMEIKRVGYKMGNERKHYALVHVALWKRYKVRSYRDIPAHKFEQALKFLTDWYSQL